IVLSIDQEGDRVNADASVFFTLWLQKPLRIAAANPSGARLADAVARCIDLARPGPVLELGAGTRSLTQGLVRAGEATRIGEYLAGKVERLAGVVSSLPIKWFPIAGQRAVIRPCLDMLGPDGCFVQLTNGFSSPVPIDRLGITGREVGRVWLNLLPAQIWAYSECPLSFGGGGAP